ncbi:MAG: fatty-acyl-CoA synthase, partial [Halioglobus sp.]
MHRATLEPNIAANMLRRADLNPERTALIFEGDEVLFSEFADRVRRQATL